MDTLQILHDLESYLGYDLDQKTGDEVINYLDDDPCETSPQYLEELFGLSPLRTHSVLDSQRAANQTIAANNHCNQIAKQLRKQKIARRGY